jgi:branched-chain amino acid transport system permease protein
VNRSAALWAIRVALFLAAAALVVAIAFGVGDFRALDLALIPIYFIAILGLNVLTGFSGQISLGHGAFMAVGGYTTAILMSDQQLQLLGHTFSNDMRDLLTIPIAGVVAGATGFLFGIPALRLTGLYLALATFAFAVALPALIKKYESFTGGSNGINLFGLEGHTGGIAGVDVLGRHQTWNDYMYFLTWAVAGLMFLLAWLLLRGGFGRALRAIRDSEVAAASSGVSPATYKTLAFAVSAFYAGVAGSLYAIHTTFVNPDVFNILLSLFLVVGAVVGGLGVLWGGVLGAVFVVYVRRLADEASGEEGALPGFVQAFFERPGAREIVFGATLIVVIALLRTGFGGLVARVFEPLTTRLYSRS